MIIHFDTRARLACCSFFETTKGTPSAAETLHTVQNQLYWYTLAEPSFTQFISDKDGLCKVRVLWSKEFGRGQVSRTIHDKG